MTPQERPYQAKLKHDAGAEYASGAQTVLIVSPTGSGKTFTFSQVVSGAYLKGRRVLILAHREELLDQIAGALSAAGVPFGFIAAGRHYVPGLRVYVGGVFSVVRRLDKLPKFDFIVGDEAHHFSVKNTWGKIVAHYAEAKILGVTATPIRLSGEGLGEIFQRMVLGPSTADLIRDGYLSPFRIFAPSTIDMTGVPVRAGEFARDQMESRSRESVITGSAVEHYRRHAPGKAAVAFCVSVAHAEQVAADFRTAGFRFQSIDGKMDRANRKALVAALVSGEIHGLTSCDLISEGFDCPRIEVAFSLRPTASKGLWIQQAGRVLRTYPGKSEALIFDHAGNTERHGFPDDPQEWSLEGRPSSRRGGAATVPIRQCPRCYHVHRPAPVCPACGHVYEVVGRSVDEVDGELVEVNRPLEIPEQEKALERRARIREEYGCQSYDDMLRLAVRRGYKPAWAGMRWQQVKRAKMGRKGVASL